MADQLTKPIPQPDPPYLTDDQTTLLRAALDSQSRPQHPSMPTTGTTPTNSTFIKTDDSNPAGQMNAVSAANSAALFMSPHTTNMDTFATDYTPGFDYLDNDESFDFEDADLGGDMIGALPGSNGEVHEKRKSPDEGAGTPEHDSKRQETNNNGEKTAKKPGRKPLVNEPTTKRKAQNRAAQRAFRERKEKHLKDLEEKVTTLEKTTEADKQENGMLKAQVERLQKELREYRKRLSMTGASVRASPPLHPTGNTQRSGSGTSYGANFQFDFPKFGALPTSQTFGDLGGAPMKSPVSQRDTPLVQSPLNINGFSNQPQSQSQNSRHNSTGRSTSPQSVQHTGSSSASTGNSTHVAGLNATFAPYSTNDNMHGFASTLPQMNNGNGAFDDLFSPNLLKSANMNSYFNNNNNNNHQDTKNSAPASRSTGDSNADAGGDSTAGISRAFQFNSGSNASDSTSPSASSNSQWNMNGNGNSSCGTSPEPSHESPALKDGSFCDKVNKAAANSQSDMNSIFGFGNTNFTDASSLGTFDPVLFGEYRDTNEAIVGGGDFTGGFFDDAVNSLPFDYQSPTNLFGILQSPLQTPGTLPASADKSVDRSTPSRNLMAEVEKTCDGGDDDYGLPGVAKKSKTDSGKFISCNNIWTQLQSNPDFRDGKFDLDGLCSELRAKAKCSEKGVLVDQDHVQAALKKLGQKDDKGKAYDPPALMFEQDSWDSALKKLQNGSNNV